MFDMASTPLACEQAPAVPSLIVIELTGSTAANVDGVPVRLAPHRARAGVVPTIARDFIREGRNLKATVRVMRGGTRVFQDASLSAWAAVAVREDDKASARMVPFRAFTGAAPRRAVAPQDGC